MGRHLPYLVTILNAALIFYTAFCVAKARDKFGIKPPATTGNEEFERIFRTQCNTIESTAYFLPLLWVFANYMNPLIAGIFGLLWLAARVVYVRDYWTGKNRSKSFTASLVICGIMFLGSLYGIIHGIVMD